MLSWKRSVGLVENTTFSYLVTYILRWAAGIVCRLLFFGFQEASSSSVMEMKRDRWKCWEDIGCPAQGII